MLCDDCGINEAILHVTKIENNQMKTYHLCEGCASAKGLEPGPGEGDAQLTEFLEQVGRASDASAAAGPCPYCGMRLEDFKQLGRLGCPQCYVTFEAHLTGLLRRLHGGSRHLGKVYLPPDPTRAQRQERLAGLRRKLDHAVQREDFERAAELRDQIRSLEGAGG